MNFIQGTLQLMEVGKGSAVIRLLPLMVTVLMIIVLSDFPSLQTPLGSVGGVYRGLPDAQSMDNAQLARQILRGKGFTTQFLRPHAVAQLRGYAVNQSLDEPGKTRDLFPAAQFPPGTPRILPDTYNSPGYPYLLAGWFLILHPEFEQVPTAIGGAGMYAPDRWIPVLNQIFLLLTAGLVFALGHRLFDQRVAWMALVAYLATDLVWKYSLSGLSTCLLMFLTTAAFYCLQEIFSVGEVCFESEERSFLPAWIWGLVLSVVLVLACLTRLPLVIIVLPVVGMLLVMPSARILLSAAVAVVVVGAVLPWFFHLYSLCGSFLGSNGPLVLHGTGEYQGNEIYCATSIPSYEQIFRDAAHKEYSGFRWNFEHAWSLLGSNPMVLLFGASVLHQFKRRRTRLFQWLIFASILALLAVNNLGADSPADFDSWNVLMVLFPCMVVVGSAFFFILLDRLSLQLWLLNNLIVTSVLLLTVAPLVLTLSTASFFPFSFPPYWPPAIKQIAQFAAPDEWVTTDMPWATAWYGDRASLWLPDSISDFENFHDNVCPTGMLLLTPVTSGAPLTNLTIGEYKDWLPIAVGSTPPANFPLPEHYVIPGRVPNYVLWSDRPRWQAK
jgi:hypothetical protein